MANRIDAAALAASQMGGAAALTSCIDCQPDMLSGGTAAFAVSSAKEVYRLGALARIERAGIAIQAAAGDQARAPTGFLQLAAARLTCCSPLGRRSAA